MELEHSDKHKTTHYEDLSPAALLVTPASIEEPTFTSDNHHHHHASSHPKIVSTPSPSSVKEETEATEYDSDCLVIVECDPADYHLSPGDGQEMSQSSTGSGIGESKRTVDPPNSKKTSNTINNNNNKVGKRNHHHHNDHPKDESQLSCTSNYSHHKLHNLPIHELKKKLAFCPICEIQCTNHKIANLCLNKHGMRQCWLCLDVIPNTKDSYFHHCVSNHAVRPSSDMVACPYCHKFFDFRQGINQHIVKVHFSEDTSFFSTTACLSPGSLVDIYTGQSRSNSNGSSSGGIGNINDTATTCSISTTTSTTAIQDEPNHSSLPTFERLSDADDSSSIVFKEIKIIRKTQEGVGGTVSQLSLLRRPPNHRAITVATRESVIRETSSWFEPNPERRSSYMQNSAMERESHLNTSRRPQSNPHPQQNVKVQANNFSTACMGESNLTLPQRPSSDPLHPSSYISLFPSTQDNQVKPIQPVEYNVDYYNTSQSTPLSGDGGDGGGLAPFHQIQNKKSPFPQLNTSAFQIRDNSLAFPDIQKMLEEPETTKTNTEFLNGVKSMLKTVADYGPQDNSVVESESGEIQNHHQSSMDLYTSTGESESDPSTINNFPQDSRSLESEDNNNFKVPSHAGVKRRILTKWDEHQEKKCEPGSPLAYYGGGNMYPPQPSNSENVSKYQHSNYHHQPFSLEGSLRAPGGLHDMPPEDQQFWEQILRESSAMYKPPHTQETYQRQFQELQYRFSLHQQQQQSHQNRSDYYSTASGQQQYQQQQLKPDGDMSYLNHLLPGVGGSGMNTNTNNSNRQFGYNNGLLNHHQSLSGFLHDQNNPACSSASGETMGSSQLMLFNPVQAHKQYEYRIVPQPTSVGNGGTVVPNHANEILNSHPHPLQDSGSILSSTPTTTSNNIPTHYNKHQQNFPLNYQPQIQSDLSTPRKRKSSFPNRVIQQPKISPGDSVVVQNPFEEEEVTLQNKMRQPSNNDNHIPLSPNSRKLKYTQGLACQRVSGTSTLMTHPQQQSSSRTATAAQFDTLQLHQQQLLQHRQNVQIQINHHHYNQAARLSNITPAKLNSPRYLYQQQQQQELANRLKMSHTRSSLDSRVAIPMMSPLPQLPRNNFQLDSRSHNGGTTGVNRSHSTKVSRDETILF